MASRWIIVITAEDGGSECYGTWRSFEKAEEIQNACMAVSSRYGGPGSDFEVDLHAIGPWPGIRAFTEGAM